VGHKRREPVPSPWCMGERNRWIGSVAVSRRYEGARTYGRANICKSAWYVVMWIDDLGRSIIDVYIYGRPNRWIKYRPKAQLRHPLAASETRKQRHPRRRSHCLYGVPDVPAQMTVAAGVPDSSGSHERSRGVARDFTVWRAGCMNEQAPKATSAQQTLWNDW